MHTPAHLLLAAAVFAKPMRRRGGFERHGQARLNSSALLGAAVPDLSLYLMVAWEMRANGHSPDQVFGHDYREPFWQIVFSIDNSVPLYALLLALGLVAGRGALTFFALAALMHLALDLPLHRDDARPHFRPITDWVFESPVSYWDPEHYGWLAGPLEAAFCAWLAIILWRRFRSSFARTLIAAALAVELIPAAAIPLLL